MDPSSSPSRDAWGDRSFKYDVFLSFRGNDTRRSFTDHLYTALTRKGIFTFRDDEELSRGDVISDQLLKAIEDSRSAIAVLSQNYASSSWCLDELVKILEWKKAAGQIVLPVFYNVEPSDVRRQKGTFADAFKTFEERHVDPAKMQKWREALTEVANLSGWSSTNRHEAGLIQEIVDRIFTELGQGFSEIPDGLVGMDIHVRSVEEALDIRIEGTRSVGIVGMGGSGKTTLAWVVYERMRHLFEAGSFLAEVREEASTSRGLLTLQRQLLTETIGETSSLPYTTFKAVEIIKKRLKHLKALIVLDDVDHIDQVKYLVGDFHWFGQGSRIIITSRDKHLLNMVDRIYEVHLLGNNEAQKLFHLHAFGDGEPPNEEYEELSRQFCSYSRGLPLAVKVLGSSLVGLSIPEWSSALEQLKVTPNREILDILNISYEKLNDNEKKVFLYIACFFHGYMEQNVGDLVHYLGYYTEVNMRVLKDRSLIYISKDRVRMHDLLRELGKNIVYKECPEEPGRRSLLWSSADILHVLSENTGTEAVEGVVLDVSSEEQQHRMPCNLHGFVKLTRLKLLILLGLEVKCSGSEDMKFLSNDLRVLFWDKYPLESLPSSFWPVNLYSLVLPSSVIQNLPGGDKIFTRLERLDLRYSKNLDKIHDLSNFPNLKHLSLEHCTDLVEVLSSRACHGSITCINLEGCTRLTSLPEAIEFPHLEFFSMNGCSHLERLPEISGPMKKLKYLRLDGTAIAELPSFIFLLGLAKLTAANCHELRILPDTILDLESLEHINLSGCSGLEKLPENFRRLEKLKELHLDEKVIINLPGDFVFPCLEYFHVEGLSNFDRFAEICRRMEKLKYLHMDGIAVAELPSPLMHLYSQLALYSQVGVEAQKLAHTFVTMEILQKRQLKGGLRLPMPNSGTFRKIGMPHSGTHHPAGGSRSILVESAPDEVIGLLRVEDYFLKPCPRVERIPTLSGDIGNIRKLRPTESGSKEIQQSAQSLDGQLRSVASYLKRRPSPISQSPEAELLERPPNPEEHIRDAKDEL
ncbi:hypothetical protein MLD38_032425 [Melastoma candidum]|uniref:Uncharacterized protein n=1 Tax=Melastoma candidum TaxID=119954 RepID=A0ACB9M7V0_9MYRT|nr:hypothetical protein MLD38_032425 [Melastoma candidum]